MSFFITRFDPGAKYGGYNQFDCQHAVINKFVKDSLKKQVKQGLSVAYALLEDDGTTQRFAGFFTIASHTIALSALGALQRGGLPKTIPGVRLIMLGIHHADAGQGLGLQLMNHALDIVKVGAQRTQNSSSSASKAAMAKPADELRRHWSAWRSAASAGRWRHRPLIGCSAWTHWWRASPASCR